MRRAALAACLLLPIQSQAQDTSQDIVVTGRGLPAPPGEAALPVVEIDAEALRGVASGRLEDALRDVAGIAAFRRADSRSANPTSQGITLRGLGGNASSRALLLLDGVPQTDPFGGWVAFPAYAPERLAGVRVTRGGGSGYQGPGALAGTVELTSAGPAALDPVFARARLGSRDSVDLAAAGAARLGEGFATLAADYARGDGFTPIVAGDRGPIDRPAPFEQASASLRAVTPLGGATELQAALLAFTDRRERGTPFSAIRSEGVDASLRAVGRGDWGWQLLGYVQTRTFASQFVSIADARDAASPVLDQYAVPATGLGLRAEVAPPLGPGWNLRAGADLRRVSGKTQELYLFQSGRPTRRREAGGVNTTAGLFVDASREAGPWTLTAGARADRWRIADGRLTERQLAGGTAVTDSAYPDRAGWEGTGRIGAAFRLTPAAALRLAGYTGWRLPTLNELYRPFRVGNDSTLANAALAPERLTGIDGGIDLAPAPDASIRATLFWNRLAGAIANVTVSSTPTAVTRRRDNLRAVEAHGAELDARWSSGPLHLAASYAWTRATVRSGDAALDGLRPAQTPAHLASAAADWRSEGWSVGATLRYAAAQWEDDANIRRLADALTLDARVAAPLSRRLAVELSAENLLDTVVQTAVSATGVVERATPRTLWIGLRLGG